MKKILMGILAFAPIIGVVISVILLVVLADRVGMGGSIHTKTDMEISIASIKKYFGVLCSGFSICLYFLFTGKNIFIQVKISAMRNFITIQ